MSRSYSPWPQSSASPRRSWRRDLVNVLTYLLPPVAVWMIGQRQSAFATFLLTLCGWIPGIIYARRILARAGHHDYSADQLVIALQHHVRR